MDKNKTWDEISSFMNSHQDCHILLGGDFNVISSLEEKIGGVRVLISTAKEFHNWISNMNMIDIPTHNGISTQHNKRARSDFILERLDRFFLFRRFHQA